MNINEGQASPIRNNSSQVSGPAMPAVAKASQETIFFVVVCLLLPMMTSSGSHVSATSLMKRYIMRRRLWSWLWNSFVTPKKTFDGKQIARQKSEQQ